MLTISEQNKTECNKVFRGTRVKGIKLLLLVCFFFLAAKSLQVSASGAQMMYALEKADVYSGPGTEYEVLGQMEEGEKIFAVELLEEGWYRVVYNGETAYVRQDALALYTSGAVGEENTLVFPDAAPPELEEEALSGEATPVESLSSESEPEGSPAPVESPVSDEADGAEPKKSSGMITGLVLAAGLLVVVAYAACLIWKEKKGKASQAGQEEAADEINAETKQKEDVEENEESASNEDKNDLEFLDWNEEDGEDS